MQFVYILVRERPGDFQGFSGLANVKGTPPPSRRHYMKVAQEVVMLAFVESQLKCVSLIENFDENLNRIVKSSL